MSEFSTEIHITIIALVNSCSLINIGNAHNINNGKMIVTGSSFPKIVQMLLFIVVNALSYT